MTALYVICLHIFRHITQNRLAIRQYACVAFVQSDEKSDCASAAQSLCGVAFTFLERFDFSGKVIKPFCTHEGSGLGGSINDIKKLCPEADVGTGLAIRGGNAEKSKADIEKWI
ncbi:MAG: hypothetical protein J6B01_05395 [Ruminococcus sp.]|nr:hypothetical protein [Ruminococcus sp.]